MKTAFLLFLAASLLTRAAIYWYQIKRRPIEQRLQRLVDEQLRYTTGNGRQTSDLTAGDVWLGWESAFPSSWNDLTGIYPGGKAE